MLDGAPAIAMAINRRARASATTIAGAVSRVKAPGFSDIEGQFQWSQDAIEWLAGGQVYGIVDAVWRIARNRPESALDILLQTGEFVDGNSGAKLGIGSSAALTAALCQVLAGSDDPRDMAWKAHRILQQGSGSGVDVACSLHGGLISYRRDGPVVSSLNWPAGLQFRLVWSGVAASTVEKIALLGNGPDKPSRAELTLAAESIAATWSAGDAKKIIKTYAAYIERLRTFSIDHKLGIFDAGHETLVYRALDANLVYKPCGAGGGDVGIVLGVDTARLDAFIAALPSNFRLVDCAQDLDGTRMEEQANS